MPSTFSTSRKFTPAARRPTRTSPRPSGATRRRFGQRQVLQRAAFGQIQPPAAVRRRQRPAAGAARASRGTRSCPPRTANCGSPSAAPAATSAARRRPGSSTSASTSRPGFSDCADPHQPPHRRPRHIHRHPGPASTARLVTTTSRDAASRRRRPATPAPAPSTRRHRGAALPAGTVAARHRRHASSHDRVRHLRSGGRRRGQRGQVRDTARRRACPARRRPQHRAGADACPRHPGRPGTQSTLNSASRPPAAPRQRPGGQRPQRQRPDRGHRLARPRRPAAPTRRRRRPGRPAPAPPSHRPRAPPPRSRRTAAPARRAASSPPTQPIACSAASSSAGCTPNRRHAACPRAARPRRTLRRRAATPPRSPLERRPVPQPRLRQRRVEPAQVTAPRTGRRPRRQPGRRAARPAPVPGRPSRPRASR